MWAGQSGARWDHGDETQRGLGAERRGGGGGESAARTLVCHRLRSWARGGRRGRSNPTGRPQGPGAHDAPPSRNSLSPFAHERSCPHMHARRVCITQLSDRSARHRVLHSGSGLCQGLCSSQVWSHRLVLSAHTLICTELASKLAVVSDATGCLAPAPSTMRIPPSPTLQSDSCKLVVPSVPGAQPWHRRRQVRAQRHGSLILSSDRRRVRTRGPRAAPCCRTGVLRATRGKARKWRASGCTAAQSVVFKPLVERRNEGEARRSESDSACHRNAVCAQEPYSSNGRFSIPSTKGAQRG